MAFWKTVRKGFKRPHLEMDR